MGPRDRYIAAAEKDDLSDRLLAIEDEVIGLIFIAVLCQIEDAGQRVHPFRKAYTLLSWSTIERYS